jgi:hypothetical protein
MVSAEEHRARHIFGPHPPAETLATVRRARGRVGHPHSFGQTVCHANGPEYVILRRLFLNKQIVISDDENNGGAAPVGAAVLPGDRASE